MSDIRLGAAVRLVRRKRGWRQRDLAARAGVSDATVSRMERGHLDSVALRTIRSVTGALDIRVDVVPRWRAGDLDRLLGARHSALHESVARWFRETFPEWELAPEVSFAIFGERGVVDLLAWHPRRRALLVIELKTDIADVNELLGTLDRKRRLAARIAAERDWVPRTVSAWVIVASGRTNRARIAAHASMVRAALPDDGRAIKAWLREPAGSVAALSTWGRSTRNAPACATRRVRRAPG
jgi:transcriptional regulator with XRE-family HTH domain